MLSQPVDIDFYSQGTLEYVNVRTVSSERQALRFPTNARFAVPAQLHKRHFDNIQRRFDAIRKLSDNWDGMGATTVETRVVKNALAFLNMLNTRQLLALEAENIMPTPYGTVELDWKSNDSLLSVEIGTNKIGFFTQFPDNKNLSSNGFSFNGLKISQNLATAIEKYFSM